MDPMIEKDMEGKAPSINSIAGDSAAGSPEYREYQHLSEYFHEERMKKLLRKIEYLVLTTLLLTNC